jgi:hypothetical protein
MTEIPVPKMTPHAVTEATSGTLSQVITIVDYRTNLGEVETVTLDGGAQYLDLCKQSADLLANLSDGKLLNLALLHRIPLATMRQARDALVASLDDSAAGANAQGAGLKEAFVQVADGVKYHAATLTTYVQGLRLAKTTTVEGAAPRAYNASDLSRAKGLLRDLTPVANWRTYKLTPGKYSHLLVAGQRCDPSNFA